MFQSPPTPFSTLFPTSSYLQHPVDDHQPARQRHDGLSMHMTQDAYMASSPPSFSTFHDSDPHAFSSSACSLLVGGGVPGASSGPMLAGPACSCPVPGPCSCHPGPGPSPGRSSCSGPPDPGSATLARYSPLSSGSLASPESPNEPDGHRRTATVAGGPAGMSPVPPTGAPLSTTPAFSHSHPQQPQPPTHPAAAARDFFNQNRKRILNHFHVRQPRPKNLLSAAQQPYHSAPCCPSPTAKMELDHGLQDDLAAQEAAARTWQPELEVGVHPCFAPTLQ